MANRILIFWGIFINILIVLLIYISPTKPVYDEIYFYHNFQLLQEKGWSRDLIYHQANQAPGPLYQAFYYCLYRLGITISIHLIRYCSFIFFNLSLWIFLKSKKKKIEFNFWVMYFSLFSVPFIYPILGMGLTETISMIFFSSAIYFFYKFLDDNKYIYIVFFALFYSISLVGRQNFLITFPCFLLALLLEKFKLLKRVISILISFCSFIPLFYFVSIWGGLVPPQQRMVAGNSILSVSLVHGILGIAYYGILFFLVNPNLFIKTLSTKMIILVAILSIALEFYAKIQFVPFLSLFNKLSLPSFFTYLFPGLLISVGVYFSASLILLYIKKLDDKNYLILLLNLAMAFSCFKVIHLFSSRYVAQASFLATGFKNENESQIISILRILTLIGGSSAGLFSLYVYYKT